MNAMLLQSAHCLAFQAGGIPLHIYASFLLAAYFAIDAACAIIAGAKLLSTTRGGWLLVAEGVLRAIVLIVFIALGAYGLLALMLIPVGILEIVAAIQITQICGWSSVVCFCGSCLDSLFSPHDCDCGDDRLSALFQSAWRSVVHLRHIHVGLRSSHEGSWTFNSLALVS